MKNWKRFQNRGLALFLALVMCVSTLHVTAFAADGESDDSSGSGAGDILPPSVTPEEGGNSGGDDVTEPEPVTNPPVTEPITDAEGNVIGERVTTTVTQGDRVISTDTHDTYFSTETETPPEIPDNAETGDPVQGNTPLEGGNNDVTSGTTTTWENVEGDNEGYNPKPEKTEEEKQNELDAAQAGDNGSLIPDLGETGRKETVGEDGSKVVETIDPETGIYTKVVTRTDGSVQKTTITPAEMKEDNEVSTEDIVQTAPTVTTTTGEQEVVYHSVYDAAGNLLGTYTTVEGLQKILTENAVTTWTETTTIVRQSGTETVKVEETTAPETVKTEETSKVEESTVKFVVGEYENDKGTSGTDPEKLGQFTDDKGNGITVSMKNDGTKQEMKDSKTITIAPDFSDAEAKLSSLVGFTLTDAQGNPLRDAQGNPVVVGEDFTVGADKNSTFAFVKQKDGSYVLGMVYAAYLPSGEINKDTAGAQQTNSGETPVAPVDFENRPEAGENGVTSWTESAEWTDSYELVVDAKTMTVSLVPAKITVTGTIGESKKDGEHGKITV